MRKLLTLLLACNWLLLSSLTPVALADSTSIGKRVTIDSEVLSQQRDLQILLPEGYYNNPKASYPVIYLLDGDYNFHGVTGMLDLLSNKGQLIPDVIVVGIADKGTGAYRQYMTPEGLTEDKAKDTGKASAFMKFLQQEVKPYVSKNYRVADNAMLFGHSMGGLFVVNALLRTPQSFDHYVAVSPSVWLHDHALVKQAQDILGKSEHSPVNLYLSLGDESQMGQYGLINLLDTKQPSNINWQFRHYPDENHNSVGIISLRNNLKHLYKNWYINEKRLSEMAKLDGFVDRLIAHYVQQLQQLKITQAIPTASVQSFFRHFYRNKLTDQIPAFLAKIKQQLPASEQAFILMQAKYAGHFDSPQSALAILQQSEQRFSYSLDYLKAMAAVYEQLKQPQKSHEYYQQAMKLAKQRGVNQWLLNILASKLSSSSGN